MIARAIRGWLARRTSTQLASGLAVMAALALTGSLVVTGQAVRMDQRQQAALAALADYGAMVSKLGTEASLDAASLTAADAAYLSAWLTVFQSGLAREARSLEETCRTGRGGAGVRYIRAPVGEPAGLAVLNRGGTRMPRLGEDVYRVALGRGVLCPDRAVEAIVVRRSVGSLDIAVGRVVDRSGQAWGWAVLAVVLTGAVILISGLVAAAFARRRMTRAIAGVSQALDRASVGDFSRRAPEVGVAAELTELTVGANRTLDRLEELLTWMRDSADQLAHDFRTPLARASTRLQRLSESRDPIEQARLAREAEGDLQVLSRAMTEAMALRDGEAWRFERVRLDELARAAVELYLPLAEAKGISLTARTQPTTVLGVRSLLQRAATNLIDNAIKFSPEAGEVVVVADIQHGRPTLSVRDQGPGIDSARLDDATRSTHSARAAGHESHGMGLAFVRAVVRRHGAELAIEDAGPGAIVSARFSS